MGNWYIKREDQQYGPYTTEQMLSMEEQRQIFLNDVIFDSARNIYLSIEQAQTEWHSIPQPQYTPQGNPQKPKKKHSFKGLIVLGVIALLIGGAVLYYNVTKTSDNIILGSRQKAVQKSIPVSGGTVTVTDAKSPIKGMTITLAAKTYKDSKNFNVSTRAIKSHTFGAEFTPITPLITIDNGHQFSNEPMKVTIPISKKDDEFAMGFYYNDKTGKLEGIPACELDNKHITLITNHFSDIVISEIKMSELDKVEIDTKFTPGTDDWEFVNYGSEIAEGGHCAGQSISAMWYYSQIFQGKGEQRLFGRFDDNNYGIKTPNFWMDDSSGYRFASVIQESIDWASMSRKAMSSLQYFSSSLTMYSFAYAMELTKEPQFVEIWGNETDKNGKVSEAGHAIVAYRIKDGKIYVSDPNYPNNNGEAERFIQYTPNGFLPYSSGTNATAIKDKGDIFFTKIYYIASSAMINYDVINTQYVKLLNGTIGNDMFSKFKLKIAKKVDPVTGAVTEWEDCPDMIKISSDDTAKLGEKYRGKLLLGADFDYTNQAVSIYKGLDDCKQVGATMLATNKTRTFDVSLDQGINDFGFYCEMQYKNKTDNTKNICYTNFIRVKVIYDQKTDLKFEQDDYKAFLLNKTTFKVIPTDAPAEVKYVWSFGTGEETIETKVPEVEHTYKDAGERLVTCSMVDTKTNKEVSEARANVSAIDLYGTWNMNFTIQKAGPVDAMINTILKYVITFINSIFTDANIPTDTKVTIEGTTISSELTVFQPDPKDTSNKIKISLQEKSSSTDFVDVVEEPILGYMTIGNDDKVQIVLTGSADGQNGGLKFDGNINNEFINGTFNAAMIMSGDFSAVKKSK
jgi:hypothetical protein